VAGARERVDAAPVDVDREGPDRLAAAHDEVAGALDAAEGVEVLPAAVRELHVADRDRRGPRRLAGGEGLEPQHALGRGHEADGHAAVDPGQGHRRELELVRQHRPVALQQVGDQVHARRGVGDEGDLVRLRPDEAGDSLPDDLAPLDPGVPVAVSAFLELGVEARRCLAHRPRRNRRGGGVQVDLVVQAREVAPHLVPQRGHGAQG
jgi:hypothetical protein